MIAIYILIAIICLVGLVFCTSISPALLGVVVCGVGVLCVLHSIRRTDIRRTKQKKVTGSSVGHEYYMSSDVNKNSDVRSYTVPAQTNNS